MKPFSLLYFIYDLTVCGGKKGSCGNLSQYLMASYNFNITHRSRFEYTPLRSSFFKSDTLYKFSTTIEKLSWREVDKIWCKLVDR